VLLAAVPFAAVEPEPTLFDGVWLLTGGVALAEEPVVEVLLLFISVELELGVAEEPELGLAEELAADWSVPDPLLAELLLGVFMLLEEPLAAPVELVTSAEVPLAEAELLLHELEIMLMEVTLREPPPLLSPPERVPWTSTWCPSWGFRVELSPVKVTSCPF